MKRFVLVSTILLSAASIACATPSPPLNSLAAIHALSNAEAHRALPVAFEATVTYFRGYDQVLFVADGDVAIYVQPPETTGTLLPGDRVLIEGITHDSYRPEVLANSVKFLRHGELPRPVPATFDELIQGRLDCGFVRIHGVIRTADIALSVVSPVRSTTLQAVTDGGIIHISLDSGDARVLKDLLDAEIEAVGVASGRFDGKNHLTGVDLNVSRLEDIRVIHRAAVAPWSLPSTPMGDILATYHEQSLTRRVLVHGTITYYQPGSLVVMQNGDQTLRIMTRTYVPLRVGDLADATGFPDLSEGFLTLTDAEVEDSLVEAPIQPVRATWQQLSTSANLFDLVSIEGRVVTEVREATQDEYVLVSDGHPFSAIFHHPDLASQVALPPMKHPPVGSIVRVTGICKPASPDAYSGPVPFDILLRSFDDVTVLAKPSWLSVRNLVVLIAVLLGVLVSVGARAWFLERRVRRQNASLAYVERRRSRILEDINSSQPLAAIVEQITELVSFTLKGAPCWCRIADGAQLGNCPPKLAAFRVVQQEIPARTGPALGVIFAALDPLTRPQAVENEALGMATSLCALAIETGRLYSDLRRRSEFDLLTDTYNRFSLDKHLDALILDARQQASIFGLIYIDLNQFKQINDLYGHQAGDMYLREVARRMKRQLRAIDLLARLGGDEFAVLVPVVRSRADVVEISERIEHAFNESFEIDGYTIRGSASVGVAVYPEDGATNDALLKSADAAMYVEKNAGR